MKLAVKANLGCKIVLYTSFKRAVQSSDFENMRFLLNFILKNSDSIFLWRKIVKTAVKRTEKWKQHWTFEFML